MWETVDNREFQTLSIQEKLKIFVYITNIYRYNISCLSVLVKLINHKMMLLYPIINTFRNNSYYSQISDTLYPLSTQLKRICVPKFNFSILVLNNFYEEINLFPYSSLVVS